MPAASDPPAAAVLVEHYAAALAATRRKYPRFSPADREDIVQQAVASVLQRLRRGPLAQPVPYRTTPRRLPRGELTCGG
jgi:hypothetical protein